MRRVTFAQEILAIQICDDHALVARLKGIEFGIGVFLALVERHDVVLEAIVVQVTEEARPQIHIVKDESTKIRAKTLNTNAG